MRIGSAFLVIVTVMCAACSQKDSAQAPPPSSSAAAPAGSAPAAASAPAPTAAGAPAPAADKSAAAPEPSSAAGKEPAPEPAKFHEVTIPVGTVLTAKLSSAIASDTSKAEDAVRGTLTKPITVSGKTVVPAGTELVGSVLEAKESGRVKGRASIAFRFSRLIVGTDAHQIHTARIAREAAPDRRGDVTKGAIGGGVGAVVGGLVGGGKGAAIGAGVGGTGAVLATKGKEVRLPAGTVVSTHLDQALVILVPVANK